jgi:hypothetical protein
VPVWNDRSSAAHEDRRRSSGDLQSIRNGALSQVVLESEVANDFPSPSQLRARPRADLGTLLRIGTSLAFAFTLMKIGHTQKSFLVAAGGRAKPCGEKKFFRSIFLLVLCAIVMVECDCSGSTSSPNPPVVTVTVAPTSATVALGAVQQFQAIVSGSSNTNVTWEVNGVVGGNSTLGTIVPSASGTAVYTAPATFPSQANVSVTAVSQANPLASSSAVVTLEDSIVVTVSPNPVSVPAGAQVFTADVSGSSMGVAWNVNGIAGGNSTVGTIVATGTSTALYTAPLALPSPPTVTVTAASAADSTKSGSASVTITCAATNSISPLAASVGLGQTQTFTASFCIAPGSSIAWDVNEIVGGNSTIGTITASGPATALFTAPADLPPSNPVTIHASVSPAIGMTASATVTVTSNITVSVSPSSATLSIN